jgi:glutaredoxin-like protein
LTSLASDGDRWYDPPTMAEESLLSPQDRDILAQTFTQLTDDVNLRLERKAVSRLYIPGAAAPEPDAGAELSLLLNELVALSPRLKLTTEEVPGGNLPSLTISSVKTRGKMRYIGLPAGHEMATLVAAIMDVGVAGELIPAEIVARIDAIEHPVHIQVFVTPSCQYCPQQARVALQLAMVSSKVSADIIEIEEFPDLMDKYQVRGVPHTVLNETETLLGAAPPMQLVLLVEKVGGSPAPASGGSSLLIS